MRHDVHKHPHSLLYLIGGLWAVFVFGLVAPHRDQPVTVSKNVRTSRCPFRAAGINAARTGTRNDLIEPRDREAIAAATTIVRATTTKGLPYRAVPIVAREGSLASRAPLATSALSRLPDRLAALPQPAWYFPPLANRPPPARSC